MKTLNNFDNANLSVFRREHRRRGKRNGRICLTSISNDDGMAACGLLRVIMTRKVPGSLSEVSRDSTKQTKMITEHENNFLTDCGKRHSSIKLFYDNFE